MPLKLRTTGLGSGIDKNRADDTVFTGDWEVASTRAPRSRQSLVLVDDLNRRMTRSDRVATLEEAKAQFQKSWDAWKALSKLEEAE